MKGSLHLRPDGGMVSALMTVSPWGMSLWVLQRNLAAQQASKGHTCPLLLSSHGDNVFSLFWVQFLIRLIHKELSCPRPTAGIQAP